MDQFRTKRGRCVFADDELRIESGVRSHVRRYWEGNKLLLAGYLALYGVLLSVSADTVRRGDWNALAFGASVVVALVVVGRVLNYRRGVTSDERIPLDSVEAVVAVEGDDWVTRPRFVVRYWRGRNVKRRNVMMPSALLSYGDREFESAKALFRANGLAVETVAAAEAVETAV